MRLSTFTHDFLLLFSGPVIWAAHFLVLYGITGVLCARPAERGVLLGLDVAAWGLVALGIAATAAIVLCLAVPPRDTSGSHARALQWMARGLGSMAVLAIGWETLPLFLAPLCG